MSGANLKYLSDRDPVLKEIINKTPKPEPIVPNPMFHDLLACVIEQQIPYRSTKRTFEKLLSKAEINVLTPENFEHFEEKGLVDLKLSENKISTISRILEQWKEMPKDWDSLSDEEVRRTLKSIKGIGPWTMDMLLLYTLERANVFPADDYHLKQLMPGLYNLDTKSRLKAQMKEVADNWSPHQSMAVRVLLEWKNLKI